MEGKRERERKRERQKERERGRDRYLMWRSYKRTERRRENCIKRARERE